MVACCLLACIGCSFGDVVVYGLLLVVLLFIDSAVVVRCSLFVACCELAVHCSRCVFLAVVSCLLSVVVALLLLSLIIVRVLHGDVYGLFVVV